MEQSVSQSLISIFFFQTCRHRRITQDGKNNCQLLFVTNVSFHRLLKKRKKNSIQIEDFAPDLLDLSPSPSQLNEVTKRSRRSHFHLCFIVRHKRIHNDSFSSSTCFNGLFQRRTKRGDPPRLKSFSRTPTTASFPFSFFLNP